MGNILQYLAVMISITSLLFSIYNYRKANEKQNYLEKDKQYADLLKIALQNPDLREYKTISEKFREEDKNFIVRYNIYAYLIWNCMETFYDLSNKGSKVVDDTWIPVIREENKIHYNWFKQNQRLFKPKFQNYINKMNDVVIRTGNQKDLNNIYDLMTQQFPKGEIKSKEKLADLILKGKYILYIAENPILSGRDSIIGYAFVYMINNYKSIWLDYLAINPIYQDSGYGTLLFNKIMSNAGGGDMNAFMEVEIPNDSTDKSEAGNRRIRFYEKQGARILDIDYKLPTEDGSLPLYLCFKPGRNTTIINSELLSAVIKEIMNNIHSDLQTMPKVRDSILENIKDIKIN